MLKPIYRCPICGIYTEEEMHCQTRTILLLDPGRRLKLSKFVSGVLRHYPHKLGLELSPEGFIDIDKLVNALRNVKNYEWVQKDHVVAIARLDPKGRFEIIGNRIRARYGHSIPVKIRYVKVTYRGTLYHGTTMERLPSILREGIRPMKRKYVHLTTDLGDACERALQREGEPVILVIDGRRLSGSRGLYKATDRIYLAKYVPPDMIVKIMKYNDINQV